MSVPIENAYATNSCY